MITVNRGIITNGLIACFDAASPRSTGNSAWLDLSGLSSNATGAMPDFTGVMNGAYSFNDLKYLDYNTFSTPANKITVEMWIKLTGSFSDSIPFGFLQYAVYLSSSNQMGFNTGNGDIYGISAATFSNLGIGNNWKQLVFVMNSDVSYSNNKMYVNGSGQILSQQLSTEQSANRTFNGGSGRIGCWKSNTTYCTPMQCSIFRIYNRELSKEEITNNFDATRARYSI